MSEVEFSVIEGDSAQAFLGQAMGHRSRWRELVNAVIANVGTGRVVTFPRSATSTKCCPSVLLSRLFKAQGYRLHTRTRDGVVGLWAERIRPDTSR